MVCRKRVIRMAVSLSGTSVHQTREDLQLAVRAKINVRDPGALLVTAVFVHLKGRSSMFYCCTDQKWSEVFNRGT